MMTFINKSHVEFSSKNKQVLPLIADLDDMSLSWFVPFALKDKSECALLCLFCSSSLFYIDTSFCFNLLNLCHHFTKDCFVRPTQFGPDCPQSINFLIRPIVVLNRLLSSPPFLAQLSPDYINASNQSRNHLWPACHGHVPKISAGLVFALRSVLPGHSKMLLHNRKYAG